MKHNTNHYAVWAGLLLCTAIGASAVPVKFQVNMTYQISQGNFTPGNRVAARGGFNDWGTFDLVNDGTGVYTNTAEVAGSAGSTFDYKFWHNGDGTKDQWEDPNFNNRSFTLAAAAQTLPLAYFLNQWAGSPPVAVTFQVDMTAQVANHKFKPDTDVVECRGAFQTNVWSGGFWLTNDVAAYNTNLYTGTYVTTNYPPGVNVEYKYFIATNRDENVNGWEAVNNRTFLELPTTTLVPMVYFSDEYPYTIPVAFQVDMSVQLFAGQFNPASGDQVEVQGDFNSWSNGFTLTNTPATPNLYSGTYDIARLPTTLENYKFAISNSTGIHYEALLNKPPYQNRQFVMPSTGQVLPVVYYSDVTFNDVLPVDTLVTFSVSMTNAQSYPGYTPATTFEKTSMNVVVNGNWVGWWTWANGVPSQALVLTNSQTSGDWIYSQTVLVPKGSLVDLVYKYGIDDGANSPNNEAPDGSDRVRYIRQTGSYTLPLDTFGTQTVETSFGELSVGAPSAGHVPVSWLGRPGVFLQIATVLNNAGAWVTHAESAAYGSPSGMYSTNYPTSTGPTFFRLVKPGS
jgi:hypothetical protein